MRSGTPLANQKTKQAQSAEMSSWRETSNASCWTSATLSNWENVRGK